MQSMTGGGHWGGGMFINAHDMARFGYLFLRNGKWKDRAIVFAAAVAIGPTTARALTERGRTPVLAESATLRGLALTAFRLLQTRH